ncbi:MAG: hypothetical protein M9894_30620 [Planctomycetes bacterium]|nr:hypothetical protein [Planctomycetota bacterium]
MRRAAVLALLLAAAPTFADDSPRDLELVLRTRLEEAARARAWDDVVTSFQQLRAQGLVRAEPRLLVRYAEAQLARGDAAAAEAALLEVLGRRPDHVAALPLLARLRAREGRAAQAADLLLAAARAGRLVLRDLAAEPDASPLRPLLRRPDFVLGVLTAARGEELTAGVAHDPFQPPLAARDDDERPAPDEAGPDLAALRAELDALFARLLERARSDDLPAVERLLVDLDELLRRLAPSIAEEELRAAQARLGEAGEVLAAARLRVLLRQGNAHLRAARGAVDDGRWADALAEVDRLEAVARRLDEVERHDARHAARELVQRARALADRARTGQAIAALRLEVTGIVLPPPGAPRTAIVNDRVHAEGDRVADPRTGEPLDDLVVVAVSRSAVRFSYRGVEFVRPLR